MIEIDLPKTEKEFKSATDSAIKQIEQEHGKGSIINMGSQVGKDMPHIPTGIISLDDEVLGIGGLPKGRIIEIVGPESCLDSSSYIQYETRTKDGRRVNHKGGSIERLYERFHGLNRHCNEYDVPYEFYAPSVNEDNGIFQNRITDVVKAGPKEIWFVETENGQKIMATLDHKFFSNESYIALRNLCVGDFVMIHNSTPYSVEEYEPAASRKYVFVKSHGVAGKKRVGKYQYHRLARSRAVVEAVINGLSYEEYIDKLNKCQTEELSFLPRETHVHHQDENALNDSIGNLILIPATEHGRLHAMERHNKLRYVAVPSRIVYKEYIGIRETYDVRMESPFNNYVAEGFVVHNSGKTTLALKAIAAAQLTGGQAAFIDVEHALDPNWAHINGVDINCLLVSQPDYGEQALSIVETLVSSGAFSIIVVDSVAALIPKAELEGEIGDAVMGLQARLMSQAMRRLTGMVARSGTILIFINQIREKIGVTYGSNETTPGGRALKFYASVRLDVRRIGSIKNGDEIIGNKVKIKAAKNKVGKPFVETEVDLLFNIGFDIIGPIIDKAVEVGVAEKSGSWYSAFGNRLGQGKEQVRNLLTSSPELLKQIEDAIAIRK